jgi:hypothetical protein
MHDERQKHQARLQAAKSDSNRFSTRCVDCATSPPQAIADNDGLGDGHVGSGGTDDGGEVDVVSGAHSYILYRDIVHKLGVCE